MGHRTRLQLLPALFALALAACGGGQLGPSTKVSGPSALPAPPSSAQATPESVPSATPMAFVASPSPVTSAAPLSASSTPPVAAGTTCAGIGTASGLTDAEALRFMTEVERLYGDATKNVSAIGVSGCLTGTALDRLTAWVAQLRQDKQHEVAEWKVDSAQFSNDQATVNNGYLVYSGSLPIGDILYDANNQVVNTPAAAGFVIDQQLAHVVWIGGQWKVADWGGSGG